MICRWANVLNPNIIKGKWTAKDDKRLLELVDKYHEGSFFNDSLAGFQEAAWLSGQSLGFECGRPGFKSWTRILT